MTRKDSSSISPRKDAGGSSGASSGTSESFSFSCRAFSFQLSSVFFFSSGIMGEMWK